MAYKRNEQILSTAEAIMRYLEERPHAAETVDGVANWWLLRQRHQDSRKVVQQALDYLERSGNVQRDVTTDGRIVYRCATSGAPLRSSLN